MVNRSGIFLGIFFVLYGCSATVDSRPADEVYQFSAPARELASCVFEALDKANNCDGLKISDYPTSGEARITCEVTAGVITTATSTVYSAEFLPTGDSSSTVRFWSMRTLPGITTYAEKVLPAIQTCAEMVTVAE